MNFDIIEKFFIWISIFFIIYVLSVNLAILLEGLIK